MRILKVILSLTMWALMSGAIGQTTSTSSALNLSTSARVGALGSMYLSVNDDDISVATNNPTLINSNMAGQLSISYVGLFEGSGYGGVYYGTEFDKLGSFVFGLQYVGYGTFEGYDEDENYEGNFTAADYIMYIGWGRQLTEHWRMGVSFKPLLSHYESYNAFAVAFDLGVNYSSSNDLFNATIMARNIGAQLITFNGGSEALPWELTAGLSYKLPKAPFRLYFTATELQRWDLSYPDNFNPTEVEDPFTGEVTKQSTIAGVMDNIMRHAVVGVEFCPSKAFNIRLGYNYRRAKEMKAATGFNFSGFSYGVGIRLKKFYLAYSRNNYHQSQAPNYITITTDLNNFF